MRGFERMRVKDGRLASASTKYRNIKCEAPDGQRFDSRRECNHYLVLKAREQAGEITELQRQVRFWLMAPSPDRQSYNVVSYYVADFTYQEPDGLHVVDAKGKRTQVYELKKKWLELQEGLQIEEV